MPVYESKNLHMKSLAFGFLIFDFDQGPPCFDICINLRKTPCPQRLKIQKPDFSYEDFLIHKPHSRVRLS